MPRVRRRGHRVRDELTSEQVMTLLIGGPRTGFDGFESQADYERAWWAHREQLMADLHPSLPLAWWRLEGPIETRNITRIPRNNP